jgi:hypothetical protein
MLPLSFFSRRAFSGAVISVALTMFGTGGLLSGSMARLLAAWRRLFPAVV